MTNLEVGDRAPDFELVGQDMETHRLSDYRGQPVVLVFYPLDFSGTCTRQHQGMCDALPAFDKIDAQVLGISVDSKHAHRAFAEQMGITYPLLADFHPKGTVGRLYGVYDADKGQDRRVTFVIDSDGRIAHIAEDGGAIPDLDEILAATKEAAE
jgi:peroxiredoxin